MKVNREELKELIANVLDVEKSDVSDETDLLEDLAVNSIMILELIGELEDFYNVEMKPNMLKEITTVENIAEVLEKIDAERE